MKNLLTRTVSGIIFIGIMVGCLLGGDIPYACLMLFLVAGMLSEFYELTLGKGKWLQKATGMLFGMSMWAASFFLFKNRSPYSDAIGFIELTMLCFFVLWLVLPVIQLFRKEEKPFLIVAYVLSGILYIAVPLSLVNFLGANDRPVLLGLFIILWSNDVGAYVFGMLFGQKGKHKLCPSISPKKSWEGLSGGILVALATGYVLWSLGLFTYGLFSTLVISLLLAVSGVFGDLIESMLKRSAGVKDAGKIIPGHGGLLDRFDAALLALPVACIYMLILSLLSMPE
ncbi:MAG: phosphatidate cytidylyltransferase [Prevotellaceae bacterium]|jgi:phosphatidate cytidylyltransferase|nr:phosphatidate cytidylyltransferase [Prevotellaceae bacterium]